MPYDFNFDLESKERVYCSKLVYLSYGGIDWPTKKAKGSPSAEPGIVRRIPLEAAAQRRGIFGLDNPADM